MGRSQRIIHVREGRRTMHDPSQAHRIDAFPLVEIGVAQTPLASRIDAPCQPGIQRGVTGTVHVHPPFLRCLDDLEGFDRVWILFLLHQSEGWRARVKPPRGVGKRGLFATRGPHRPSPLGLTCARLVEVAPPVLTLDGLDLLDGTPVVDIKPYIAEVDAFPDARAGWVEAVVDERPRKRR